MMNGILNHHIVFTNQKQIAFDWICKLLCCEHWLETMRMHKMQTNGNMWILGAQQAKHKSTHATRHGNISKVIYILNLWSSHTDCKLLPTSQPLLYMIFVWNSSIKIWYIHGFWPSRSFIHVTITFLSWWCSVGCMHVCTWLEGLGFICSYS